jgi:HK97 family phage major capsid protein
MDHTVHPRLDPAAQAWLDATIARNAARFGGYRMAHPLLEKAAQHTAQARAINDEFEGKSMPAEAAHQMKAHLDAAREYRSRVGLEASLTDVESWIKEPQHKHDMSGGQADYSAASGGEFKGGSIPSAFGNGAEVYEQQRQASKNHSFFEYVRKGLDGVTMEQKADLVENATGQNLVPTDYAGTIIKQLPREGVIRDLAFVRPTNRNVVDIGNVVINTAGWGKLETGTTPTDGMGTAGKDTITVYDLNALVKLGNDELEDTDENLAEIIRVALVAKLAELEDDAFAAGTGTGMPWGITHNVTQNVTAAANNTVTSDDLKRLPFQVPAQFRRAGRACFLGHTLVTQAIALLKDTTGAYMLQQSAALGEPDTLFGYRYYTVDGLAAPTTTGTATDASLVFGDINAGYMIADRRRFTVTRLNELYAAEGKVGLLFTHRVGGDVIRPQALATYRL